MRIFFSSIIDASIKLVRSFPWEWNKNKTKQNKHTNEETLNLWIDLENWEFLETQGNLAFYVTALLEYVHLMFLRIFYDVIVLNALHWLQLWSNWSWCYGNLCGKIPFSNLLMNTDRIVAHQNQSVSNWHKGRHWKRVHSQTLKRVPTYIICRVRTDSC